MPQNREKTTQKEKKSQAGPDFLSNWGTNTRSPQEWALDRADNHGMATNPTARHPLVLCDGDLPSMVALSLTADAMSGLGSVSVLSGPITVVSPEIITAKIHALAESQAARCHDFPAVAPVAVSTGHRRTRYLFEAVQAALSNGCTTLVCPWQAEGLDPDTDRDADAPPGVDALARELDRALLVSRLVTLDASEHGVGVFEIQTPLMDLSDRQVAEMALDLDVPIWRAWWWDLTNGRKPKDAALADRAAAYRQRWESALIGLGWSAAAEASAAR